MDPVNPLQSRSSLEPSSTGLDARLAATLCYLLGFVSGLVFLLLERKSSYVRFHAMQSTITFLGLLVLEAVVGFVPILGSLAVVALNLVGLIVWVFLMVKAFQGERYKLPTIGDMAEERSRLGPG